MGDGGRRRRPVIMVGKPWQRRMRGKKAATVEQCVEVLRGQSVGRLGMIDGETPYVVPVFYMFDDGRIIFHSSIDGLKMELLGGGGPVCFEVDSLVSVVAGEKPCDWSAEFASVLCFGYPRVIADPVERAGLLAKLVERFIPGGGPLSDAALAKTAVVVIDVDHMTGKVSGQL